MSAAEKLAIAVTDGVTYVRHDQLVASPLNPRKHARTDAEIAELAESIRNKGVLQNLVARPHPSDKKLFEIAAGEGRWRAVLKLILDGQAGADYRMPVAVRELDDVDMIEIGLIENLQRADLHPLDEARAFLDLYERASKTGGKKAAAKAIDAIAAKINRTPRYVQKRIKIARDLIPEWTQLLEEGSLKVHIAQLLSAMPAKAQKDELTRFNQYDTRPIDKDRVRAMTAKDFADEWRPLKSALFDRALYEGETEEVDGDVYATDRDAFDELQKQAAAALTKEMRAKAKDGEIEFFETGQSFNPSLYEQQKVGAEPDPAGGVFLEKHYSGEFHLFRGLFKTKATIAHQKEEKERNAKRAKEAKRQQAKRDKDAGVEPATPPPPDDPRIPKVHRHLHDHPASLAALVIYMSIVEGNKLGASRVSFAQGRWLYEAKKVVADQLRKIKDPLPAGPKLLEWLLTLKPSQLLGPVLTILDDADSTLDDDGCLIEKPSAAEKVLFDLAGATLPSELALKAKPKPKPSTNFKRTASKSKPKKKGKRK